MKDSLSFNYLAPLKSASFFERSSTASFSFLIFFQQTYLASFYSADRFSLQK